MTNQQLDELVASIGDEMLTRLGRSSSVATQPRLVAPTTGCSSGCETNNAARPEISADWTPQAIELDCRDARLTTSQIRERCVQAQQLGLGAVNVLPGHALAAEKALRGAQTRLVVSVGWPHGTTSTAAKAVEAELALGQGADEIELTVPLGSILASADDQIYGELRFIAELVHSAGRRITAAIETADVDPSRLIAAAAVARLAHVDALCAASSVVAHGMVSPASIRLLYKVAGDEIAVKASCASSGSTAAQALVAAGATTVSISNVDALTVLAKPTAGGR